MALFEIAGDAEQDQGTRFLLGTDAATKEKVYFWLRRIPGTVDDDIRKRHPGKWNKKLKQRIRSAENWDAIGLDRLKWALTRIDGPLFAPLDDEAVKLFSEATGQALEKGKNVYLNGDLTDETKRLLFNHVQILQGEVLKFLREVNEISQEEEEETVENLSPGSSGSSTPTSPK